ncbi:M20/M25/M40 family metallo-hydrolase [Draconibacterium sp.]
MKLRIVITLLLIFIGSASFSEEKELKSITENELKAHLEFIAIDYMQGRDFGTPIPGLEITAEYLKSQCLGMGLKPGQDNFSQTIKMVAIQSDNQNTFLKLKDTNGNEKYKSAEIVSFPGSVGNDTIKTSVVFAGYGYESKDGDYNDFDGIDITGKTVMIMTRNREMAMETDSNTDITNTEMAKLARIFMSGAKAIIYVSDPLNTDKSWFEMVNDYALEGTYQLEGAENFEMPGSIILANNKTANAILQGSGKTLEEVQQEINESGKPNSFEVQNVVAEIQLVKKSQIVQGENIIGIIEGSDPKLKNECVVLTAHYDHIGITSKGEINNGADDNGSGTVALLEIAEAFSQMKKKPRRSIVFAWVTAEEKGLVGSEFYTLNPVFPLENTVANINLDMVGRSADKELEKVDDPEKSLAGPNGIYIITGDRSSELTEISNKISKKLGLIPSDALTDEFMSSSDQYNFYKNGIPVIAVSTGLHDDYHKPGDDFVKIDYHKMKRICDYTFLVVNEVANRKQRLVLDKNPEKITLY